MKSLFTLIASVFFMAGCQSPPAKKNPLTAIDFANNKFSVFMVSVDDSFDFEKGKFYRSSYTIQEKLTVKLPGVEGIYADFLNHCISLGNAPQIIDGLTLVCLSPKGNIYAVNAIERGKTAWLQVIEPTDVELKKNTQGFANYALSNFISYVDDDVSSTNRLLRSSSLYKNVPNVLWN